MAKRLTEEEKAEIRRLRGEGLSYRAIGRKARCSHPTVARLCDQKQENDRKS